jgi:hypothetical protein
MNTDFSDAHRFWPLSRLLASQFPWRSSSLQKTELHPIRNDSFETTDGHGLTRIKTAFDQAKAVTKTGLMPNPLIRAYRR